MAAVPASWGAANFGQWENSRGRIESFSGESLPIPREGDETETTERGGGSKRQIAALGPRDGDETTPIRESPSEPPVRV